MLVHRLGNVIFFVLLYCNSNSFLELNKNRLNALCGLSIDLTPPVDFFMCPSSFETGPITLSSSSTIVSESSSYATWLLSKFAVLNLFTSVVENAAFEKQITRLFYSLVMSPKNLRVYFIIGIYNFD